VTLEIVLTHEDGCWRARAPGVDLAHAELNVLDALIEARLAEGGAPSASVRFDFAALPEWLRQYQTHYFNYALRPAPPGAPGPASEPEPPAGGPPQPAPSRDGTPPRSEA
jgi:hypothetical protein